MERRKIKKRLGSKKNAGRRRLVKLARFDTTAVKSGTGQPLIRIYDRKVKMFLRGEWEISHALAILMFLLDHPNRAVSFGYTTVISVKAKKRRVVSWW